MLTRNPLQAFSARPTHAKLDHVLVIQYINWASAASPTSHVISVHAAKIDAHAVLIYACANNRLALKAALLGLGATPC